MTARDHARPATKNADRLEAVDGSPSLPDRLTMAREHRHEIQHSLLRTAERVERCSRRFHVAYELVVLPLRRGHHASLQPVEAMTDTVPRTGEHRIGYEWSIAFADGGRELVGRPLERGAVASERFTDVVGE